MDYVSAITYAFCVIPCNFRSVSVYVLGGGDNVQAAMSCTYGEIPTGVGTVVSNSVLESASVHEKQQ